MSDEKELEIIAGSEDTALANPPSQTIGMRCQTCMVSSNCPQFRPGADCSIDFKKIFNDLGNTLEALKESAMDLVVLQYERIQRAAMQEKMNYGTLDPNLTNEINAYFKMMGDMKKFSEKPKEKITIEAEGKESAGILSQYLGLMSKDKTT